MTNKKLHMRFRLAPNRWRWITLSCFLWILRYFAFLGEQTGVDGVTVKHASEE